MGSKAMERTSVVMDQFSFKLVVFKLCVLFNGEYHKITNGQSLFVQAETSRDKEFIFFHSKRDKFHRLVFDLNYFSVVIFF